MSSSYERYRVRSLDGSEFGPLPESHVIALIEAGLIASDALILSTSGTSYLPIVGLDAFANAFDRLHRKIDAEPLAAPASTVPSERAPSGEAGKAANRHVEEAVIPHEDMLREAATQPLPLTIDPSEPPENMDATTPGFPGLIDRIDTHPSTLGIPRVIDLRTRSEVILKSAPEGDDLSDGSETTTAPGLPAITPPEATPHRPREGEAPDEPPRDATPTVSRDLAALVSAIDAERFVPPRREISGEDDSGLEFEKTERNVPSEGVTPGGPLDRSSAALPAPHPRAEDRHLESIAPPISDVRSDHPQGSTDLLVETAPGARALGKAKAEDWAESTAPYTEEWKLLVGQADLLAKDTPNEATGSRAVEGRPQGPAPFEPDAVRGVSGATDARTHGAEPPKIVAPEGASEGDQAPAPAIDDDVEAIFKDYLLEIEELVQTQFKSVLFRPPLFLRIAPGRGPSTRSPGSARLEGVPIDQQLDTEDVHAIVLGDYLEERRAFDEACRDLDDGRFDTALERFEKLSAKRKDCSEYAAACAYSRFMLARDHREQVAQIDAIKSVLARNPFCVTSLIHAARMHIKMRRAHAAFEFLERAFAIEPERRDLAIVLEGAREVQARARQQQAEHKEAAALRFPSVVSVPNPIEAPTLELASLGTTLVVYAGCCAIVFVLSIMQGLGATEYFYDPSDGFFWARRAMLLFGGLLLSRIFLREEKLPRGYLRLPLAPAVAAVFWGVLIGHLSPIQGVRSPLPIVLSMTVLHVAAEESFFRLYLDRALKRSLGSSAAAALIGGLLFGFYHLTYYSFWVESAPAVSMSWVGLISIGAGVPYALFHHLTRSLGAPFLCHLTVNCVMMFASAPRA